MIDMSTVREVNALIEYMGNDEVVEVNTDSDTYIITKRSSSFYAVGGHFGNRKTKLYRPPILDPTGHFYMYLNSEEFIKSSKVKQILLDDRLIFETK